MDEKDPRLRGTCVKSVSKIFFNFCFKKFIVSENAPEKLPAYKKIRNYFSRLFGEIGATVRRGTSSQFCTSLKILISKYVTFFNKKSLSRVRVDVSWITLAHFGQLYIFYSFDYKFSGKFYGNFEVAKLSPSFRDNYMQHFFHESNTLPLQKSCFNYLITLFV